MSQAHHGCRAVSSTSNQAGSKPDQEVPGTLSFIVVIDSLTKSSPSVLSLVLTRSLPPGPKWGDVSQT